MEKMLLVCGGNFECESPTIPGRSVVGRIVEYIAEGIFTPHIYIWEFQNDV